MTDYATYQVLQDGNLAPTGTVDARSPEAAISKVAKERHAANGDTQGTFVAILQRAVTTVGVTLSPSVEVKLDSDRVAIPRKPKEEAKNNAAPSEPVPA